MAAPTCLDHGAHSGGGTPVATNSIGATFGRLLILVVHSVSGTSVTPVAPTVTGCGGTWSSVGGIGYDSSGTGQGRIDVFRCADASGSGALSIAYASGTPDNVEWSIEEIPDADVAGGPSSNGVVQVVTGSGATANPSLSLAALAFSRNYAVGALASEAFTGVAAITPGAGFVELSLDTLNVSQPCSTEVEYQQSATTVNWTRPGTNSWGAIGIEIAMLADGPARIRTPNRHSGPMSLRRRLQRWVQYRRTDDSTAIAPATDAGTDSFVVGQTGVETIVDSGAVVSTVALQAAELVLDLGADSLVGTPTGVEVVLDQAVATATGSPSGADAIADASSVQATLVPSGTDAPVDSGSATGSVSPSSAETILDQATLQATATPTAAETIVDQSADLATVSPTGSGGLPDSGTIVVVGSVSGSETLVDQATVVVAGSPSSAETTLDSSTLVVSIAPTGADAVADLGSTAATVSTSGSDKPVDSGSAPVAGTPSGAETVLDLGSVAVLATLAALAETIVDGSTVTATGTPTGVEGSTAQDTGTVQVSVGLSGVELLSEAAVVALVVAPSAVETLLDAASGALALSPSGSGGPADQAAATILAAPSGSDALVDQAAAALAVSLVGAERAIDLGVAVVVVSPSGSGYGNPAIDAGTVVVLVTPTGQDASSGVAILYVGSIVLLPSSLATAVVAAGIGGSASLLLGARASASVISTRDVQATTLGRMTSTVERVG